MGPAKLRERREGRERRGGEGRERRGGEGRWMGVESRGGVGKGDGRGGKDTN